jgi:iron(II)-dependent oxidoreductase
MQATAEILKDLGSLFYNDEYLYLPFPFNKFGFSFNAHLRRFSTQVPGNRPLNFQDESMIWGEGSLDDGGYRRKDLWTGDSWHWLQAGGGLTALEQSFSRFWSKDLRAASDRATGEAIEHPVYWHREASGRWRDRIFDQREALNSSLPVVHVSWYEAEAYCRWAGRRLPAEAEWECAAAVDPTADPKRLFPWGSEPPGPERANLEGITLGRVEVGALPAGDSAFGCRQMIGNVWEWTADEFQPYPGFLADPYKEYSQPWFGTHKVLRGGCWVTRARLIRNTWRNFYTPDRRDVWAGFRTCALRP